jgi:hypothetical protein
MIAVRRPMKASSETAEYLPTCDLIDSTAGRCRKAPEPVTSEPWRLLAAERRFEEAARQLGSKESGLVGMGYYASHGYAVEEQANAFALGDDLARARALYEQALESYLLYSLFPARGDSEEYGYELAGRVLDKIEKLA